MAIFIDSGIIDDIKEAMSLGYVSGVTTNPLIMAKTDGSWRETLKEICKLTKGPVYYQIDEVKNDKLLEAVNDIYKISPEQIIVKLPAAPSYFRLLKRVAKKIPCCMTAVYTEAQLLAAAKGGAHSVAVYVHKISMGYREREDLKADGPETVANMRELIDKTGLPTKILAGSLRSPDEVIKALKAGAHNATTSLKVLREMATNPLSNKALEEFNSVCANNI